MEPSSRRPDLRNCFLLSALQFYMNLDTTVLPLVLGAGEFCLFRKYCSSTSAWDFPIRSKSGSNERQIRTCVEGSDVEGSRTKVS